MQAEVVNAMPVYEYECTACHYHFELQQRFSDPPVTACPECAGPVRKVYFPASVIFKGSGWYVTDNRKDHNGTARERSAVASAEKDKQSGESGPKPVTPAAERDTSAAD